MFLILDDLIYPKAIPLSIVKVLSALNEIGLISNSNHKAIFTCGNVTKSRENTQFKGDCELSLMQEMVRASIE